MRVLVSEILPFKSFATQSSPCPLPWFQDFHGFPLPFNLVFPYPPGKTRPGAGATTRLSSVPLSWRKKQACVGTPQGLRTLPFQALESEERGLEL